MREHQKEKAKNVLNNLLTKKWISQKQIDKLLNDIDNQPNNRAHTYCIYGGFHLFVGRAKEQRCYLKFINK